MLGKGKARRAERGEGVGGGEWGGGRKGKAASLEEWAKQCTAGGIATLANENRVCICNQGYVCTSTLPAGATVKKAKVQDPDQKYQVAASVAHTSGYSIGRCRGKCHCSRALAAAGGAAARGSDVAAAAKATTSPPPASRRGVLMSCPAGGAAHNPGSWKPNYLSDGIKAVAQQLVSFHSKLELVVRATPNTLPMSTHPGLPLLCPTCCIYIPSS